MGVLGPSALSVADLTVTFFSIVPEAMYEARFRTLEECRVSSTTSSRVTDRDKGVARRNRRELSYRDRDRPISKATVP